MITKEILWQGYLYKPKRFWFLLWLFENDSERFDYPFGIPTSSKYYSKWLYNACYKLDTWWKRFLMAYWFNAIRNSMVNFNNYMAYKTGKFIAVKWAKGCVSFSLLRMKKKGYRLENRLFFSQYDNCFKERLYLEFYLFKRWFQFGWLSNGRFEIDLWKKR